MRMNTTLAGDLARFNGSQLGLAVADVRNQVSLTERLMSHCQGPRVPRFTRGDGDYEWDRDYVSVKPISFRSNSFRLGFSRL